MTIDAPGGGGGKNKKVGGLGEGGGGLNKRVG